MNRSGSESCRDSQIAALERIALTMISRLDPGAVLFARQAAIAVKNAQMFADSLSKKTGIESPG